MRDQYGLRLSRQQTQLFEAWSRMDPVDEWEYKRDEKIMIIQGNSNCLISQKCETIK
jgi:deoxyribonuclease I